MDYFFYGTLMDPDVLGAVISRPVSALQRERAVLPGYRRVYRLGAWYPILVPAPEESVEGLLLSGFTLAEAKQLAAFEGYEYELIEMTVRGERRGFRSAWVFMARPGVSASSQDWALSDWRRRHRKEYLRRVRRARRNADPWLRAALDT